MTGLDDADLTAIRSALTFTRRALTTRNEPTAPFDHAIAAIDTALATQPIADNGNPKTDVDQTELNEWVSVTDASQLLGCSERRVRQIAPAIGATKRGGSWWIPRSALPTEEQ